MMQSTNQTAGSRLTMIMAGTLLGLSLLAGCGGDEGPQRHNVKGIIKYDGVLVTSGRITFTPDVSKGHSGPAGWAMIEKGIYDTAGVGGQSPISGPMTVLITGYGEPPAVKVEFPAPLFPDYTTTAEIDSNEKQIELDFDVPATKK